MFKTRTVSEYHEAMADIICWIDGFRAASRDSDFFYNIHLSALMDLKRELREIWRQEQLSKKPDNN